MRICQRAHRTGQTFAAGAARANVCERDANFRVCDGDAESTQKQICTVCVTWERKKNKINK